MSTGVRARTTAALLVLLAASGCSHLPHWPWHRKAPPAPQPVHELVITTPDGQEAAFPQYWKRNTLVIDLQSATGTGSVHLTPLEHTLWPVRLAFRVMPGQVGQLEVTARQRLVLPITTAGTRPVDLELDPGVFIMKSPGIDVAWGPADQPSEPAPAPLIPEMPPADHSSGN